MLGIPLYELFGLSNDSIPSPHENIILSQYRQLSRVGQKVIDKTIHSMLEEEIDTRDRYLEDAFRLLPLKTSFLPISTDQPSEYAFVKRTGYNEAAEAAIRVSDASLEPYYHSLSYLCPCHSESQPKLVFQLLDFIVWKALSGAIIIF